MKSLFRLKVAASLIVSLLASAQANNAATTNAIANPAAPFRAMVIHPVGQFDYHEHDLDWGLAQNGIAFDHYGVDNPDAIRSDFEKYDLVMCTPLVNINDVLGGAEEAVRAWVRRGNAVVVTDGCNGQFYNPWLANMSGATNQVVDACPCYGTETIRYQFVRDLTPPHPLRCFPETLDFEARQWNCLKPSSDWETVVTCTGPAEIHPDTVVRPVGHGLVYLSSMQQRWHALPANMIANLRMRRMGLAPVSYSLTPPAQGAGCLHLVLKCLDKPTPVQFRLQLSPAATNAQSYWTLSPVCQPGKDGMVDAEIKFAVQSSCEGPAFLSFEARTPSSAWVPLFRKSFDVPPALTVCPPRYRGRLSTGRRVSKVGFDVLSGIMGPHGGFNAAEIVVTAPDGYRLGVGEFRSTTNVSSATVAVPLPLNLKAGDHYAVKAQARSGSGRILQSSTNFVVRPADDHPGEVIIDEDNTFLVDGKPFFPIGIYHLIPDDYPDAAAAGFNMVGTLQWMTRNKESLEAAEKLGLKVMFENNEKEAGGHYYLPGFLRDHPALFFWYAPDEPGHELGYRFAAQVDDIYRQGDPFHPIILSHFNPVYLSLNASIADVLAPQCYAWNEKGDQPYWRNVDMTDVARESTSRRKPVVPILFCCGHQDSNDIRANIWAFLAHDARGLLFYAWDESQPKDDVEGLGLKYHDDVKAVVKGQIAQVSELMPALLAPVRRTFVTTNNVHGIVCDNGAERTLLVINMNKDQQAQVPSVPEFKGLTPEPLFGAPACSSPLAPFENRAYRCRLGPEPAARPAQGKTSAP